MVLRLKTRESRSPPGLPKASSAYSNLFTSTKRTPIQNSPADQSAGLLSFGQQPIQQDRTKEVQKRRGSPTKAPDRQPDRLRRGNQGWSNFNYTVSSLPKHPRRFTADYSLAARLNATKRGRVPRHPGASAGQVATTGSISGCSSL